MEEMCNVGIFFLILQIVIHFVMYVGCLESNASIFLSLRQTSCQNETHKMQLRMCVYCASVPLFFHIVSL